MTKFPTGSKCFKSSKTTYSLPYFVITNLDAKPYINGQFISTFDQFLKVLGSNKVSGNWGGTPWAYQKMYDGSEYYAAIIYANINNKLSEGFWDKSPNITLESRLKEYTDLLNQPYVSLEDKISFNAGIEEVNKECTYYNDIAANTIETLIIQSSEN